MHCLSRLKVCFTSMVQLCIDRFRPVKHEYPRSPEDSANLKSLISNQNLSKRVGSMQLSPSFRFVKRHPLATILILALALRIGIAVAVQARMDQLPDQAFLIEGDANGYWYLGGQIACGGEYAVGPRQILRMPGLPALLAISNTLFGESYLAARCVLALIGTLACGLVYVLGRDLFDRRVGLLATAGCAFAPTLAGFSVVILTETLFAACMLWSLWTLHRLARIQDQSDDDAPSLARRTSIAAMAGVAIAFTTYARPVWLLAGFVFLCVSLCLSRRRLWVLQHFAVMHVVLGLMLLPWIIRNYHITDGHIVPTTLWVGPSLYDGLNPTATGASDMQFIEDDRLSDSMNEFEIDRHYRALAVDYAIEHPGRAVSLALAKLVRMWTPWPSANEFQHPVLVVLMAAWFLPVVGLAMLGSWKHRSCWLLLFTVGPAIYLSAIHMLFVGSIRYRLPAEYTLAIVAAAGLCHLIDTIGTKPGSSRLREAADVT